MRKLIILLILLTAFSIPAEAAVEKATLINSNGDKVVVAVGSQEAQLWFGKGYVLMTPETVGAVSGPEFRTEAFFHSGLTAGGRVLATSSNQLAVTLTAANIKNFDVIDFMMNGGGSFTLTLPPASALRDFIPKPGQYAVRMIRNATTTVQNITIAGNTGTVLKKQSGGALTIAGDTDASNYAILVFIRRTSSLIVVNMLTFVD